MLLKISKKTPRCPKRLPGDEYTGESQLPSDKYTRESQLPSGEYTGESWLPCDEYLGSQLLSVFWTSIRTGLPKNFLVTPQCIKHRGVSTPWSILRFKVIFLTNLGRLPSVFTTEESGESRLPDEYTGSLDSPVVSTPGSRLKTQITHRILKKFENLSRRI